MISRTLLLTAFVSLGLAGRAVADHHEDPQPAAGPESVARAQFTHGVSEREPLDELRQVTGDIGRITFFTELRDLEGHTVIHRWEWKDKLIAEVAFEVRGPRWRVWSSKEVLPDWQGAWKVTVVDGGGSLLAERTLEVTASAANDAATPPDPDGADPSMDAPDASGAIGKQGAAGRM